MKLSVIVPMYNVSSYVRECLDSLVCQTLQDMEVIMVDDGCTDDTPSIAQEYANYNMNFHLIHKKNGGLSDARNYGMKFAKGEYIGFLDSDDFVEPTLYEKMIQVAEEGNDIVVTDIEYYYAFHPEKCYVMKGLSSWDAPTIQKRALLSPMFAWNKIYRASLFKENELQYPVGTWYEDIPVTTILFAKAKNIGYLEECLMHYRQREDSIMASVASARIKEIFNVMDLVRSTFQKNGLYDEYHDELEYLHIEHLRLYGMFRFIRSPYWKECYNESKKVMKKYFPRWKKNQYIQNLTKNNRIFLKCYNKFTAWAFHAKIR